MRRRLKEDHNGFLEGGRNKKRGVERKGTLRLEGGSQEAFVRKPQRRLENYPLQRTPHLARERPVRKEGKKLAEEKGIERPLYSGQRRAFFPFKTVNQEQLIGGGGGTLTNKKPLQIDPYISGTVLAHC